jgi:dihydroorotase-like cyclic amidohydrolase
MALLVKNGEIVTASERYMDDIFCADETITRIEPNIPPPPGAEVIDATGKYVFPGFIDPHVHIYLPCMGTFAKDTHETASQAALVGGTTTLIEMLGPDRNQEPMAGFELWLDKAQGHCACDFTFHMRDGVISTLASDHAPFDFATQKRMDEKDSTKIPNGIPALEDRVNAFYTYGVKRGRVDLHRFVDAAST